MKSILGDAIMSAVLGAAILGAVGGLLAITFAVGVDYGEHRCDTR